MSGEQGGREGPGLGVFLGGAGAFAGEEGDVFGGRADGVEEIGGGGPIGGGGEGEAVMELGVWEEGGPEGLVFFAEDDGVAEGAGDAAPEPGAGGGGIILPGHEIGGGTADGGAHADVAVDGANLGVDRGEEGCHAAPEGAEGILPAGLGEDRGFDLDFEEAGAEAETAGAERFGVGDVKVGDGAVGVPDDGLGEVLLHEVEEVGFAGFFVVVLGRFPEAVAFGEGFGKEAFEEGEEIVAAVGGAEGIGEKPPGEVEEREGFFRFWRDEAFDAGGGEEGIVLGVLDDAVGRFGDGLGGGEEELSGFVGGLSFEVEFGAVGDAGEEGGDFVGDVVGEEGVGRVDDELPAAAEESPAFGVGLPGGGRLEGVRRAGADGPDVEILAHGGDCKGRRALRRFVGVRMQWWAFCEKFGHRGLWAAIILLPCRRILHHLLKRSLPHTWTWCIPRHCGRCVIRTLRTM